jgi:hypothetical protein
MRRSLVAVVSTAWFCVPSTYEAKADQCDAVAGELAARVPGVNIARRSSVAVFALHPASLFDMAVWSENSCTFLQP